MKKKQIFALLLCGVLSMSALGGCGGNSGDGGDSGNSNDDTMVVSLTEGYDLTSPMGKISEYSIVLAANAPLVEQTAATNLQSYVKQVTGVQIGYATDGSTDGKRISLGRTKMLENAGIVVDEKELNGDGFVVKTIDDDVYICGGNTRGTIYGVYDVIEYWLGVKFLTNTYTYAPNDADAQVYRSDRVSVPTFEYRTYLDPAIWDQDSEYATQRRFTSGDYLSLGEEYGGNMRWYSDYSYNQTHNSMENVNIAQCIRDGKIADEYMHAFSNNGGAVITKPEYGGLHTYAADLCFTDGINADGTYNETVTVDGVETKTAIGLVIENMKERILNDSEENNYYLFGQADIYLRPCLCAKCLADSEKYTDTGIMIRFVNALANAISSWKDGAGVTRDVNFIVFAYQYSCHAPVEVDDNGGFRLVDSTCKAADNVYVRLAPISAEASVPYDDDLQERAYGPDYITRWSYAADHFMCWTYEMDNVYYYWWFPTYAAWRDNFLTFQKMGLNYLFMQGNFGEKTAYQNWQKSYVASKLMWNPLYDINALVEEFNYYYFGAEASAYIREYEGLMQSVYQNWRDTDPATYKTANGDFENNTKIFTKSVMQKCLALFDAAISATENSATYTQQEKATYLSHVQIGKLMPRYMYLYNANAYGETDTDVTLMARSFILDAMSFGAIHWGEGQKLDLEQLIYRR